jgi:hypothetical protein
VVLEPWSPFIEGLTTSVRKIWLKLYSTMLGGKPPFFDGTSSFDYSKRNMKMYLGSINNRVWEVTEHDFVILDPANPTDNERANKQCNIMALNTIYNDIDAKVFKQVKCGQD